MVGGELQQLADLGSDADEGDLRAGLFKGDDGRVERIEAGGVEEYQRWQVQLDVAGASEMSASSASAGSSSGAADRSSAPIHPRRAGAALGAAATGLPPDPRHSLAAGSAPPRGRKQITNLRPSRPAGGRKPNRRPTASGNRRVGPTRPSAAAHAELARQCVSRVTSVVVVSFAPSGR